MNCAVCGTKLSFIGNYGSDEAPKCYDCSQTSTSAPVQSTTPVIAEAPIQMNSADSTSESEKLKFIQDKQDFWVSIETFDDYVEYRLKHNKENIEGYLTYEGISNDTLRETRNSQWQGYFFAAAITFIISIAISLSNPYFASFALFALGFFLKGKNELKKHRYNYLILPCEKYNVVLIDNEESENAVKQLKAIRNVYLRKKYFSINWGNEVANELNRFSWLKSLKVISESEFEETKKQLLTT